MESVKKKGELQKLNILRTKRAFSMKQKNIFFIIFKELSFGERIKIL